MRDPLALTGHALLADIRARRAARRASRAPDTETRGDDVIAGLTDTTSPRHEAANQQSPVGVTMQNADVVKLTEKYKNQGYSLEEATNKAYVEASSPAKVELGSSAHLRVLTDGANLTLIRPRNVDVAAETKRLMSEGMSLEDANNAAFKMSVAGAAGHAPAVGNAAADHSDTEEVLERFLIRRAGEEATKRTRESGVMNRAKPSFEGCMHEVQQKFPNMLPSRQRRLALQLLERAFMPPGGDGSPDAAA